VFGGDLDYNRYVIALVDGNCARLEREDVLDKMHTDEGFRLRVTELAYQNAVLDEKIRRAASSSSHRRSPPQTASIDLVASQSSPVETSYVTKWASSFKKIMLNDFLVSRQIGKGTFSKVFLVMKGGSEYAMKVIDRKKGGQQLAREIRALERLRHKNIIRLLEVIDDSHAQEIYLIQEYAPGGQLDTGIVRTPAEVRRLFRDCLSGLYYLHKQNVIHGDIKPANLLIDAVGTLKIGDFGSSIIDSTQEEPTSGTIAYTAPEILVKARSTPTKAGDVWSCGVTLYEVSFNELPFSASPGVSLRQAILGQEVRVDVFCKASDIRQMRFANLVHRMLARDCKERVTAEQALLHEWFFYA
jgi:serine/threonine protein kinase